MQATADKGYSQTVNTNNSNFSSYIKTESKSSSSADATNVWNNSLSTSDSSGSWTHGEGLPPPPNECDQELTIQPNSIPCGPAKSWDLEQSDEDFSDEGVVAETELERQLDDSESNASDDDHETADSECTTEIFVPNPQTPTALTQPLIAHRRLPTSSQSYISGHRHRQQHRRSEVIPSVSNDYLCRALTSPPVKLTPALTSEDISTNIDSGISNETSHIHSHDGTVINTRTMSVSSSSHYSSSYSCGSRGDIPSPKIGQNRVDDITVYMREAKVSRVVSFLSVSYAVLLILLGFIFPIFGLQDSDSNTVYAFEGFYIYLYGLGIFFLIYVYATVIKDKKVKDAQKKRKLCNTIVGPGAQPVLRQCSTYGCDRVPTVGSLFIRVAAVLFCVGSIVNSGLIFGAHLGDGCSIHFLSTVQPVVQAAFLFFEIYFIFSNTKMCVRQYPIVAKFGMMHLIATNISIWVLSTITEVNNELVASRRLSERRSFLTASNQTFYYMAGLSETESLANLLSVINYKDDLSLENCTHADVMVNMAYKAKPYVYPCTVQFCVLASCILFVMWRKVDTDADSQCSDCREQSKLSSTSTTRTIDCSNTSRGLSLGIVLLVAAIASLIVFFILTSNNYYDITATLIIHIYQIAAYLLMTVIAVVVLLKLRTLDHNSCRSSMLEDMLIVICLFAILTHDLIGIISGILNLNEVKGLLVLATSAAELIQSVVQMAAIIMGLKLCMPDVIDSLDQLSKPGRECVTFLAVANIALWVLSIFSNIICQSFGGKLLMVGQLSWSIIMNIVNPLVMFYHIYAASCFVDIWYNAYRMPSTPAVHL